MKRETKKQTNNKAYYYREFYIIKGLLLLGIVNKIHKEAGNVTYLEFQESFEKIILLRILSDERG